jgi:hypothetical protein
MRWQKFFEHHLTAVTDIRQLFLNIWIQNVAYHQLRNTALGTLAAYNTLFSASVDPRICLQPVEVQRISFALIVSITCYSYVVHVVIVWNTKLRPQARSETCTRSEIKKHENVANRNIFLEPIFENMYRYVSRYSCLYMCLFYVLRNKRLPADWHGYCGYFELWEMFFLQTNICCFSSFMSQIYAARYMEAM